MEERSREVALDFVDAVNRHDVIKLLSLMTEDHTFVDTWNNRETKEDMRRGWPDCFAWFPDYRVEVTDCLVDGDTVAIFGYAGGTYSSKANPGKNRSWRLPAAWRVGVEDRLVKWQVFCDAKIPLDIMSP